MWDVFEQPWTLLGAAVIVLFVVWTIRGVWPEKARFWQWLLPLSIAALAFGLDYAVATDLEKINAVVKAGVKAAEEEDCRALARLIANDYQDSYHKSKEDLIAHCQSRLTSPAIEKVSRVGSDIKITPPEAVAAFTIIVHFNKDSYWAKSYKPSAVVALDFYLRKQPDNNWLIRRVEVKEVDKMSVNWGVTRVFREPLRVAGILPSQSDIPRHALANSGPMW
ncbi:MAG: hypothetical protein ABFE01_03110 [Phycisphaerales bacterium]|jgi:hypothetical protein